MYEYARQNIALPRPIESRKVTISAIDLTEFTPSSRHPFKFPENRLDDAQVVEREKMLALVAGTTEGVDVTKPDGSNELGATSVEPPSSVAAEAKTGRGEEATNSDEIPPTFELEMTVSSGTYVRSVVHDLGLAVGSAAHVVVLTRTRQGAFVLENRNDDTSLSEEGGLPCVDWSVLERAVEKLEADEEIEKDDEGWAEWELEILKKWPDQAKVAL